MQLVHSRGQYIERIVRNKEGVFVRATFFIYESHGRIKARLMSVASIVDTAFRATEATLRLALEKVSVAILPLISKENFSAPILSNPFAFLTSQPTRAPSISN